MSTRISELTAITSVDEADVLPIVDVSAGTTKRVTVASIVALAEGSGIPQGNDGDIQVRSGQDFSALAPPAGALVGTTHTQALTNKTIVAADNNITDTSAVVGDVFAHNGTRFGRLAKGADGTFLGVESGTLGYYTPDVVPDVADDIAKSVGADIDRVRGFTGIPFDDTADGAAGAEIGAVPVYNEVGGATLKFKKPVPGGWFDVTDYGATGDGVTDDTAAIQAALDAMGGTNEKGGPLFFPPGNYYCAGDIHVSRAATIQGLNGGALDSLSVLTFAAGKQIHIWAYGAPPAHGLYSGQAACVRDIDISTSRVTTTAWAALTAYAVGDTRIVTGANWAYVECIKAGTSAASFDDEDVPFQQDDSVEFQPNTQYRYAQLVRGSTDQLAIAANGSNLITSAVFRVTTPTPGAVATSGGTRPVWDTTLGNTTTSGGVTFTAVDFSDSWVTDGTALWAAKVHSGILIKARAYVSNVFVYNATNAAITIRANTASGNANGSEVRNCRAYICGIGFMVSGADSNVCLFSGCSVTLAGNGMPGNGGVGYYDNSFLGCTWISCQVENDGANGGGPCFYRLGGAAPSTFVGCYTEGDVSGFSDSRLNAFSVVVGGIFGAPVDHSDGAVVFDTGSGQSVRNMTALNNGVPSNKLSFYTGRNDGICALAVGASNDSNLLVGLNRWENSTSVYPGWWSWGSVGSFGYQAWATPTGGITPCTWPSGQALDGSTYPFWVTQTRLHVGEYNVNPPSIGFDATLPASLYFKQGSLTLDTAADGTKPVGWQCIATGTGGGTQAPINAGQATQAMADANQTAAVGIYSRGNIKCTGALTGDKTLTLPHPSSADNSYSRRIRNATTGGFNIVVSTGTGTTVNVAPASSVELWMTPDGVE